MNKTTLFIIIGTVFVGGLLALAFFLPGSSTPAATTTPSGQNPGLPAAPAVTTVTPKADEVAPVQADAIITDPATTKDPINSGYYYLGYHVSEGVPDSTATVNPPYIITYISATHYFNIALLQEPIGPVRIEAEQYLMTRLGITENQMCSLDYMVSVPYRVNLQFSGKNLGFSFCPGATVLPK